MESISIENQQTADDAGGIGQAVDEPEVGPGRVDLREFGSHKWIAPRRRSLSPASDFTWCSLRQRSAVSSADIAAERRQVTSAASRESRTRSMKPDKADGSWGARAAPLGPFGFDCVPWIATSPRRSSADQGCSRGLLPARSRRARSAAACPALSISSR